MVFVRFFSVRVIVLLLVLINLVRLSVYAQIEICGYRPFQTIHAESGMQDLPVVRLIGPRKGSATGVALIRTSQPPIRRLRASMTTLQSADQPRMSIPSRRIKLYYASRGLDFGPKKGKPQNGASPYFDALLSSHEQHDDPVQPIYIHLPLPKGVPAGDFHGELQVRTAQGQARIPVHLTITPFTVPDGPDRIGWVDMLQSPDSVAYRYGVPLYSARHLKLLEPSMRKLANLGSRVMHVPVVARTNFGNDESMIPMDLRTIDFSGFERYFAAYRRIIGNPCRIVLYVDEQGHKTPPYWTPPGGPRDGSTEPVAAAYDHTHKAQWKALMDGIRQRVVAAGIEESAILLGWIGDDRTYGERVAYWQEIAPYARWVHFTHGRGDPPVRDSEVLEVAGMPVAYRVLPYPPRNGELYPGGWELPLLQVTSMRHISRPYVPVLNYRSFGPVSVSGRDRKRRYRGFSRLGLDFWRVATPGGEERFLLKRFVRWHNLQRDNAKSITVPGAKGALPTVRYLNLWEGIQENEAALLIEQALAQDPVVLSDDLKQQAENALAAWRSVRYCKSSQWRSDDEDDFVNWATVIDNLYTVAALLQEAL